MFQSPRISIVTPVYNAELFLPNMLCSIKNQTYENYELICVDDGSNDNSVILLAGYQMEDCRLKIIRQDHLGVSEARKRGLQFASGDYVGFVDADDWIEPEMLEMFARGFSDDVDIGICGYDKVFNEIVYEANNLIDIKQGILDKHFIIEAAYRREKYRGVTAWLWNKMFKKSLIDKVGYESLEIGLRNGEDVALFTSLAMESIGAFYINKVLYHYRLKKQKAIDRLTPETLYMKEDVLKAYQYAINNLEKKGGFEREVIWLKSFYCYHATMMLRKAIEWELVDKVHDAIHHVKRYLDEYKICNFDKPMRIEEVEGLLEWKRI